MKKKVQVLLIISVIIVAVFSSLMLSSCRKYEEESKEKGIISAVESFKFGGQSAKSDYPVISVSVDVNNSVYKIPQCSVKKNATFELFIGDADAEQPQIVAVGEIIDLPLSSIKRLTAVISYEDKTSNIEIYITNTGKKHTITFETSYGAAVFNGDGRAFGEAELTVWDYERFSFTVGIKSDFSDSALTVTVNGKAITPIKRVYIIEKITTDIVVNVSISL